MQAVRGKFSEQWRIRAQRYKAMPDWYPAARLHGMPWHGHGAIQASCGHLAPDLSDPHTVSPNC